MNVSDLLPIFETGIQLSMVTMVGIYFIFSNTVMTSLRRHDCGANIMVEINDVILNPIFLFCFVVSGVGSVYLAVLGNGLTVYSSLIFFIGTTLVTVIKNVPLNDKLKGSSNSVARATVWQEYLQDWVFWNHVRTVSAVLSALLILI